MINKRVLASLCEQRKPLEPTDNELEFLNPQSEDVLHAIQRLSMVLNFPVLETPLALLAAQTTPTSLNHALAVPLVDQT